MKVILVFVSTLNGKITRGNDPEVRNWSSESDQLYYAGIWKESKLIVMGSRTFNLNVISPSPSRLVMVMSGNPGIYKDREIPGQIEFTEKVPSELVSEFSRRHYDRMTVVGGAHLATSFLKDKLIDELWLTIEPALFGRGQDLIVNDDLEVRLELKELIRANDKGTLITKYNVIR
jgi:dihydrofolate reductase